jgi:hypothetical protein
MVFDHKLLRPPAVSHFRVECPERGIGGVAAESEPKDLLS